MSTRTLMPATTPQDAPLPPAAGGQGLTLAAEAISVLLASGRGFEITPTGALVVQGASPASSAPPAW